MTTNESAPDHSPDELAMDLAGNGWQPLPLRARTLFTLSASITSAVMTVCALVAIGLLLPDGALKIAAAIAALLAIPTFFVWLARKRYRYTRWRLDDEGFALRRGKFWSVETRIPGSRVQHLDLVRGPLERRFTLATLVIHTAGTRQHALSVGGLDADEAERLRDTLAARTDLDDDA
ncbi:MAG: PH domain-containing protein [Luteimonas sp.]|nr:PH domain-containing protein [Luteimonas sp.]